MKKVFILTEGGENKGFGHITRCTSLYQAFEEKGIIPEFIVINVKFVLLKLLHKFKRFPIQNTQMFKIFLNTFIIIFLNLNKYQSKIIMVIEYARHGARAPVGHLFDRNVYKNEYSG